MEHDVARLTAYCAALRAALTDMLTSIDYAQRGLPAGAQMLACACDSARLTLAGDTAGVQAYQEQQLQMHLNSLVYLFADEVHWQLFGTGRRSTLGRPRPLELKSGLAELETLTTTLHALTGVTEDSR